MVINFVASGMEMEINLIYAKDLLYGTNLRTSHSLGEYTSLVVENDVKVLSVDLCVCCRLSVLL